MEETTGPGVAGARPPAGPSHVTAAVLTHKRPTLAGDVVRLLLGSEGLAAERVVVVVNGEGGLDDPALEASVRMVRLPENRGPATGFRAALTEAFSDPGTRWAYLCEDDIGLLPLPSPRLGDLLQRVGARQQRLPTARVGAVVAYGRSFCHRGAHTVNTVPPAGTPDDLAPVDVAAWGATLVSRDVFEAGVLPDADWYFGLEDFDFYCRVRAAGFTVLVDARAARRVAEQQSSSGRDEALRPRRPTDADESWRSYYHARNSFALARRHGTPGWHAWHLAYSAHRLQRSHSRAEWSAIAHGLWDGARGRMGENPRYGRRVGELAPVPEADGSAEPPR